MSVQPVRVNKSDRERLEGVDPRLVRWVFECYQVFRQFWPDPDWRPRVLEGVRSKERQMQLVAAGENTWTLDSRHLTGHAVDLIIQLRNPQTRRFEARWENKLYMRFADDIGFPVAKRLGLTLRWGGDWNRNGDYTDSDAFDGPHWEIPR